MEALKAGVCLQNMPLGSLRTRQELLHSGADAAGGVAKIMVADALKESISSVPIPVVSGLVGWAVSEFVKNIIDRVDGAREKSKQCGELANLLQKTALKNVIEQLDQLADMDQISRARLIALCELISDVNLILCVADSESGHGCCAKVTQFIQSMSHTSIQRMRELVKELREYVDHHTFLLCKTAANQDPKWPPQYRTISASGKTHDEFSWPRREGPIFQHGSTLVPHIRRLLATTRNVGIVGMPGIGKTTIAEAVFECATRDDRFDATVWLKIGPGQPNAYNLLKVAFNQLNESCRRDDGCEKHQGYPDFSGAEGGLRAMRQRVHEQKLSVLLVLDDVRHSASSKTSVVESLNFVTSSDQAVGGSRLLVTTRQRSTLAPLDERGWWQSDLLHQVEVFEVPSLSSLHAMQLFHHHAFKVTREAASLALHPVLMEKRYEASPYSAAVETNCPEDLMACDAKTSADLSPEVDACGGNPGAVWHLAEMIHNRYEPNARLKRYKKLRQVVKDGTDAASEECEKIVAGLLPSVRDCFIACAAFPEGYWVPEATLLHFFATHAPLHVPESVVSAKYKLWTLVDCSLLCELVSPASGRRWYSLPRILHRLALRHAHSSAKDEERKGTRSFDTLPEDKQSIQYLSLYDDRCLLQLMQPTIGKLQAAIITRARPSSITKGFTALEWPRKLQLLNIAFYGRDDVADQAWQSEPCNGDLFLLNSLCLAGDRAPLILLNRLLHARQLLHVDLSGCVSLKRLPECIGDCEQLLCLHLSGCTSLQKLPDQLGDCKVLADLDLSECSALQQLPWSIEECISLTRLSLSGCTTLQQLPDGINKCTKLEHLDLRRCSALAPQSNGSTGMPEFIEDLKALTHLDMRGCSGLASLPDTIQCCTHLKHLCLSTCSGLTKLPAGIGECSALVNLNISDCTALEVATLPQVSSLKHVSLAGLLITEVPTFVISLSRLTHLDLSRCAKLKQLPQSEPGWPLLEHLDLSNCSTQLQTSQGLTRITALNLQMLTHLDLSRCAEMSELKVALDNLNMLAHLSLQNCPKLVTLPEGLGCCSQLTRLDLSMCSQLQRLPMAKTIGCHLACLNLAGCGQCAMEQLHGYIGEALVHIELSGCSGLQSVPDCWGNCSRLTHLDLEGCSEIERLPPSIRQCTQLAHLNLKDCSSMEDLQDCVGVCTFLTEVNLFGCKAVQGLPECIGMCLQLARLDLRGCTGIRSLPRSLAYCSRLQSFVVQRAKVPLVADLQIFKKKEGVQALNSKVVTYMHSDQWGPGAQGNNEFFAC